MLDHYGAGWIEGLEKSYHFTHPTQPIMRTYCPNCGINVDQCNRCNAFFKVAFDINERGNQICCGSDSFNYGSHICGKCQNDLKNDDLKNEKGDV